jgi:DNA-binding NtrC family response regulator
VIVFEHSISKQLLGISDAIRNTVQNPIQNKPNESGITRVLLVDDDQDVLFSMVTALESNGFVVDAFSSPDIALEKFKPNYYELLLLDIRMPGMTGFELFEEINKLDGKVHVIFITAFEVYYEALKEIYPDLVPSSFIQKPISNDDLVGRIRRELSK